MVSSALHNRFLLITFTIFIVLLGSTILAWKITSDVIEQEAKNRFYQDASDIKNWVQEKLNLYILAIEGLHGFIEASNEVRRDEWSRYIKRINLIEKYPGISSANYIQRVADTDKESFLENVRNDTSLDPKGYPDFNIYPDSKKEEYFVVKYIEPSTGGGREKALGFDISSEDKRFKALDRARDSGKAASTGRITLATTNREGFALLVPVYNSTMDLNSTTEQRRANLTGFIYAVFRGSEMFSAVYGKTDPFPDIDFEIYEDNNFSEENLLYDHDPSHKISDAKTLLSTKDTIAIDSQEWIINIASKDDSGLTKSQQILPLVVLISGLTLSLAFLGLFLYRFKQHLSLHSIIRD